MNAGCAPRDARIPLAPEALVHRLQRAARLADPSVPPDPGEQAACIAQRLRQLWLRPDAERLAFCRAALPPGFRPAVAPATALPGSKAATAELAESAEPADEAARENTALLAALSQAIALSEREAAAHQRTRARGGLARFGRPPAADTGNRLGL